MTPNIRQKKPAIVTWLAYVAITLAVLAPLLGKGYILVLDMVFTPKLRTPESVSSSYLLSEVLHILNFIVPSDALEKVMLFSILLLAGVGSHLLVQNFSTKMPGTSHKLGRYFAGTLYMINPFTYDRFMAGQYDVLLGYALLPWFACALFAFLERPVLRQTLILTLWTIVISIVSIHSIGLVAIVAIVAISLKGWHQRKDKNWFGSIWKFGALAIVMFVIASSYWLIPLLLGHGNTATTIDSFKTSDQAAFTTTGSSVVGRLRNVLHLQGFWAEKRNLYTLPQAHVSVWGLLSLLILALVIVGAIKFWRDGQRFVVACFGLSAIIAITLAIGTFNIWLAAHVPLFAGYREPEKFVALVALAYAVFAARGTCAVLSYCHEQGGKFFLVLASIILLLVPLLWTSTMLWGFNNQLAPVQYPEGWFALNSRLDSDSGNFQTLFLPWHQYMYFNFAGRIIANPAPQFFDKQIIISNDAEFKDIPPTPNATDTSISNIVTSTTGHTDLASKLAYYHIKYILLDNDGDYMTYAYLHYQSGLQLVAKSATLELYRNQDYKEK